MTEPQFYEYLGPNIGTFQLSGSDFSRQLKHPYYNKQLFLSEHLKGLTKSSEIKFIPLCSRLRELLHIAVNNLDD